MLQFPILFLFKKFLMINTNRIINYVTPLQVKQDASHLFLNIKNLNTKFEYFKYIRYILQDSIKSFNYLHSNLMI